MPDCENDGLCLQTALKARKYMKILGFFSLGFSCTGLFDYILKIEYQVRDVLFFILSNESKMSNCKSSVISYE